MRAGWLLLLVCLVASCGPDESGQPTVPADVDLDALVALIEGTEAPRDAAPVQVDYPREGAVFPPDIAAPTVLWHDDADPVDAWVVHLAFADDGDDVWALVDGAPQALGEIDREALGATNEVYQPTPHQASARAWRPAKELWEQIKRRTVATPATLTFHGVRARAPGVVRSRGSVTFETSEDPVGAPIFYRDVPLMPALSERSGQIQPIKTQALPLIAWRMKDIGREDSRAVLRGMPSCANCHSFSRDGRTLAMDVDGPNGDKGAYAIAPVRPEMRISSEQVITWNSFPGKWPDHRTIGFLSRVSPDGAWVLSTVNEDLYVANFTNYRFLQVFFPTRGILAAYSTKTGRIEALPGADDSAYVHCNPVWSPDGKSIVFSRAKAIDAHVPGRPLATEPNDPNEPRMLYDLYRMDFAEGRGGTPVPVEGASGNGMSNTFPKISPDGKWIVYTKCRNGLLLRPDGRLWIVPLEGGEARELACNLPLMNSWHSFSPNGRWLLWSSKSNTPYTQMFLSHLDEEGNSTPAILVENATAANRAVNLPEFVNAPYDSIRTIHVPAVNHHLHFAKASDLLAEDRIQDAIGHLEKALEADPDFSRAHTLLAYGLLRQNLLPRAEEHLQRALELDPESPAAHAALGGVRLRQQRVAEAKHHYQSALRAAPRNFISLRNLGVILEQEGRDDEALESLLKALAVYEADPVAHRTVAEILVRRGSPDALKAFSMALSLTPDDAELIARLAWVQATHPVDALRDGARALELAEEAARRTLHAAARPLAAIAAAQAELGRWEEAEASARRALSLAERADPSLAGEIRHHLRVYRQHRPWRER